MIGKVSYPGYVPSGEQGPMGPAADAAAPPPDPIAALAEESDRNLQRTVTWLAVQLAHTASQADEARAEKKAADLTVDKLLAELATEKNVSSKISWDLKRAVARIEELTGTAAARDKQVAELEGRALEREDHIRHGSKLLFDAHEKYEELKKAALEDLEERDRIILELNMEVDRLREGRRLERVRRRRRRARKKTPAKKAPAKKRGAR